MEKVTDLIFKDMTFQSVEKGYDRYGDFILFKTDKKHYKMFHRQDCCENVFIQDIVGDLDDLVNSQIIVAELFEKEEKECGHDVLYSFYTFRTNKGTVQIIWGADLETHYSVSVDIEEIENA